MESIWPRDQEQDGIEQTRIRTIQVETEHFPS
jgi:hypothetical protein